MMYRRYPLATLGPCRCQGCGETLWWARRMSRRLGINAMRCGWREDDGTLHRCPNLRTDLAARMDAAYNMSATGRRRRPQDLRPGPLHS